MNQFDLDRVIYRFNGVHDFTIRDSYEGICILGANGSGKSSGSGKSLAHAFLKSGYGGIILCSKSDEVDTWVRYAKETGREDSVLIFDDSGDYRFPFLQYEIDREGKGAGNTENLVRIFMTVHETISRRSSAGGDVYWVNAMEQLLRNAIDLCLIARGEVSVPLLYDVVRTAPQSLEEAISEEWRSQSTCWKLILEGHAKELEEWTQYDFDTTAAYWLQEFPNISSKTRSGIVSMFTTTTDIFMRRPFRMLFSEPPEDASRIAYPELTHFGALIILALPVKEYGDSGRGAQALFKLIFEQATERRNVQENPRPVFLWVDEAQQFLSHYDTLFMATARSARVSTVYLSQNLPLYYSEMGGESSRHRVNSLVGLLQTKIFHANSCPETGNYASETIGKSWQIRQGQSQSIGGDSLNFGSSQQEALEWDVIPQTFSRLRKGGPENDYLVEGIVFQNGRIWPNNKTHLVATFNQLKP